MSAEQQWVREIIEGWIPKLSEESLRQIAQGMLNRLAIAHDLEYRPIEARMEVVLSGEPPDVSFHQIAFTRRLRRNISIVNDGDKRGLVRVEMRWDGQSFSLPTKELRELALMSGDRLEITYDITLGKQT